MMFAKFCEVMDYGEYKFLSRHLQPGFQTEVLQHMEVLEREIYYYANCFAGETLAIYLCGDFQECPKDFHGDAVDIVSSMIFNAQISIYQHRNNALLAMGRVKKLMALPTSSSDLPIAVAEDIQRLVDQHG